MKKILIFNDTLGSGGTENLLIDILRHISQYTCEITLLLPFPSPKNILIEDVPASVKIIYLYPTPPRRIKNIIHENLISFFPRLYAKLLKLDLKQYDQIVSFKNSIYSIIFSRAKCPKLLWIHNLPFRDQYKSNSIKEYMAVKLLEIRINRLIRSYRKFNDVVCVSQVCLDRYTEVFNRGKIYKGQELHVVYNAVDLTRIDKLSEADCKFEFEHPVFIQVTRFSSEKRVDRIIEAAKRLKQDAYKFHVVIIGDGNKMEEGKKMIESYSLNDTISVLGYIKNPYPYIKNSDWLVCSSEKESFSLAIIESIRLGTPVITTDCGGPREIVENGKFGILTENSTEGIYEAMKKVLNSPTLSDVYKAKADECLKRFDYKDWLLKVEKLIAVS